MTELLRTIRLVAAVCLLFPLLAVATDAQISGAIYTTNHTGGVVNGNVYRSKQKVYLNGGAGPNAPCSGNGLPDGSYYFQVTNPSGSALLSSDSIYDREVMVTGGVITATTGSHQLRNGVCGSKIVKLEPFDDTPSPSGEYKAWLTPVASYDPLGSGFHGFRASDSKTDNFKVTGPGQVPTQSIIEGFKFYDFNENGVWDVTVPQEVPIAGWRVEIYLNGVLQDVTFTDDMGRYAFIRDLDGTTYEIEEVAPPPGFIPAPGGVWLPITPVRGAVVANAEVVAGPSFGNLSFQLAPGVGRSKGFWHNQGESILAQNDPLWRDALNGPPADPVCLRRNLSSSDPLLSIFMVTPDPPAGFQAAFDELSNWIVGEPAWGHAGFILSTQVAATILNNAAGFMQGTIYIDRFGTLELVSLAAMLTEVKVLLCHPNAGLTGPNDPVTILPNGMSLRDALFACLNEYVTINQTGTLTNPQVVYKPGENPENFESPYDS